MPPKKLVPPNLPRSARASFKKIEEILTAGIWDFPEAGKKYMGTGAPGRYLEDLLGIQENNADSPALNDWEIKFHGGTSLLTLFHKDPEPRGIIKDVVNDYGWEDEKGRISFRHTISGESPRGFYVVDETDKITIRNNQKIGAVPYWMHNTILNACSAKMRRMIVVDGEMLSSPRRVVYRKATAYWEPNVTGFINAIVNGLIFVDFDARTQEGKGSTIRNHGTKFRIKKDDLSKIFAHEYEIIGD